MWQVFKCESFAYNASSDVIQAEQMADAQLKALVQEWEAMLDSLKARVEDRVSEELNPMVYPQVGCLFVDYCMKDINNNQNQIQNVPTLETDPVGSKRH